MLKYFCTFLARFYNNWLKEREKLMSKSKDIQAVYEEDLEQFLSSIGILFDIDQGLYNCYFCENVITRENFFACFPVFGNVAISCDSPSCMMKLLGEQL